MGPWAALALGCLGLQWWVVHRTALPAPDALRCLNMAQTIRAHGLLSALVACEDQPAFPLLVQWVQEWLGGSDPQRWLLAAQVVASISATAAVLVLYALLRQVWSTKVAWLAAAWAGTLPVVARMGADATEESLSLLLWLGSLACALWACQSQSAPKTLAAWAASGVLAAGAWSTGRLAFALAVLPFACWWVGEGDPRMRSRLARVSLALTGFTLGVAVLLHSWQMALGPQAPGGALAQVLGWTPKRWPVRLAVETPREVQRHLARAFHWRTSDGRKMAFWKKDPRATIRIQNPGRFFLRFLEQWAQAFHYLAALLVLGGLALAHRGKLPPHWLPCSWSLHRLLAALWIFQLGFLLGGTWYDRYISHRYFTPLVVLSLPWAVGAGGWLSNQLGTWLENHLLWGHHRSRRWFSKAVSAGMAVALGGVCVLKWADGPEPSHLAHRRAACWVAACVQPSDAVLHTRGWTRLWAPCRTYLFSNGRQALADPQLKFVVVERRELQSDSRRAQTLREVLQVAGRLVQVFPASKKTSGRDVLVFAWSPRRFAEHYAKRPGAVVSRASQVPIRKTAFEPTLPSGSAHPGHQPPPLP